MYQDTYCQTQISIHVPREGDDYLRKLLDGDSRLISIHVPREGDDNVSKSLRRSIIYFNPRPP